MRPKFCTRSSGDCLQHVAAGAGPDASGVCPSALVSCSPASGWQTARACIWRAAPARQPAAEATATRWPIRSIRTGAGKIGQIAATRTPCVVRSIRGDEEWLANPGWIARQGVRAFPGLPATIAGDRRRRARDLRPRPTVDEDRRDAVSRELCRGAPDRPS